MQEENVLQLHNIMSNAPKSRRSFQRRDFLKVKKKFSKVGASLIKFEIAQFNSPYIKLGITVSRKYGNAVKRNRFKRLVREAFRVRSSQFPSGTMIHALAKSPQILTFAQISSDFDHLLATVVPHGSQTTASSGTQQT